MWPWRRKGAEGGELEGAAIREYCLGSQPENALLSMSSAWVGGGPLPSPWHSPLSWLHSVRITPDALFAPRVHFRLRSWKLIHRPSTIPGSQAEHLPKLVLGDGRDSRSCAGSEVGLPSVCLPPACLGAQILSQS